MASSQKVRGCEPKTPGKPFCFPVSLVCWSSELLISPGTGQQQGHGGSSFKAKEYTSSSTLPAVGEAVLLPSRKINHLVPLIFMRSICSPLHLFFHVSDFPASLRGKRHAKKPLQARIVLLCLPLILAVQLS